MQQRQKIYILIVIIKKYINLLRIYAIHTTRLNVSYWKLSK